jgi:hypothetical protein
VKQLAPDVHLLDGFPSYAINVYLRQPIHRPLRDPGKLREFVASLSRP